MSYLKSRCFQFIIEIAFINVLKIISNEINRQFHTFNIKLLVLLFSKTDAKVIQIFDITKIFQLKYINEMLRNVYIKIKQ